MKALKTIRIAILSSALLIGSTVPAFAAPPAGPNASAFCTAIGDFGGETTHGGCVSTMTAGGGERLTWAAYAGRCQWIRANDPASFYATPENPGPFGYGFGGTIGSCAKMLEAFHTGGGH